MSLRVALVCPYSLDQPGGVATHVLGLAAWLRSRGHRPFVVAPGTGPSNDDVHLLGRAVSLPFNGSVAHLGVLPDQAMKARAAIDGADLVHVHEPLTPGVAYAVARSARNTLVVTHHAHFRPGLLGVPLRLRAALLPPRQSIAVSEAAAETARIVTGAAPVVVPNAVEVPIVPPAAKQGDVVLFVGRLNEPRKGYPTFAALADLVPEATFVAIGPGTGGAAQVRELGSLSNGERNRWLEQARVLVAPNRFGESFGIILIEALARGCAVVASDLPAFRAVVDDDAVASFFPPDDLAVASAQLRSRLASPADPVTAWQSARRFSWDVVGPQIEDVYARALAGA
ncbi:glycosyltransferase family 4 protein [Tessaracoccus sp. MC1756]|uniref:glycosyltransferase family 4 protein n=1 Tax=Tessaracoccus sp. MC1756 TaxID=2760311 RepID=UPI0016011544|nr:glycosyltransferase family 4 protein [Tessaracoccus sp. MC1756]